MFFDQNEGSVGAGAGYKTHRERVETFKRTHASSLCARLTVIQSCTGFTFLQPGCPKCFQKERTDVADVNCICNLSHMFYSCSKLWYNFSRTILTMHKIARIEVKNCPFTAIFGGPFAFASLSAQCRLQLGQKSNLIGNWEFLWGMTTLYNILQLTDGVTTRLNLCLLLSLLCIICLFIFHPDFAKSSLLQQGERLRCALLLVVWCRWGKG